jgi:hypothetical protein
VRDTIAKIKPTSGTSGTKKIDEHTRDAIANPDVRFGCKAGSIGGLVIGDMFISVSSFYSSFKTVEEFRLEAKYLDECVLAVRRTLIEVQIQGGFP